jgi:hypothetical protein
MKIKSFPDQFVFTFLVIYAHTIYPQSYERQYLIILYSEGSGWGGSLGVNVYYLWLLLYKVLVMGLQLSICASFSCTPYLQVQHM